MQSVSGRMYQIGLKIASGAYGSVFNCKRDDGKIFALKKFIKDQHDFDLGTLREISILKILNNKHCGLMDIKDIILHDDIFYIVMIKYPLDLYNAIINKKLTFTQKLNIVYKLSKSIAFLSHNGILHRDIKPSNIMLDKDLNPILCDFSLSKLFDGVNKEGTHTGTVCTITYRAPEVINNEGYGYPADYWSLGVIIYELFSENGFSAKKDKDTLLFFEKKLPLLKKGKISNIIKGLLIKDQYKRFSALDVLKKLFKSSYKPESFRKTVSSCKISDDVKNMCENFNVEKKVTQWAAQHYINISKCSVNSAVLVAYKFFETELFDFTDFEEFPEEEEKIFIAMDYNLFI